MRPRWWLMSLSRFLTLGCLLTLACEKSPALLFPSATQLPTSEPRPAGVNLDLASPSPAAQTRAPSEEHVVALRTPLGEAAARRTIRAFFDAVLNENPSALSATILSNAMVHDLRPRARTRQKSVMKLWRHRFRKREYPKLRNRPLYRDSELMTYRSEHIAALPTAIRQAVVHKKPPPHTLILRVPLTTHTMDNERFFSKEMTFWLTPTDRRYFIYNIAEAFPF